MVTLHSARIVVSVHRHSGVIVLKYNIGLKRFCSRAYQNLPIFYCDLVYKFKIIAGTPNFSDQFTKIIKRYKKLDRTWTSCDSLHAWL